MAIIRPKVYSMDFFEMFCNPSCFHLLWQIQHHFSKCLYSCTARPLFRSFLQLNYIQRSRDRNFLGKIVSVYPRARQPTASVVATSVCAATRLRLRCRDRDSAIIHQNMHTGCFLMAHKEFSVQKSGARFVETRGITTQGTRAIEILRSNINECDNSHAQSFANAGDKRIT